MKSNLCDIYEMNASFADTTHIHTELKYTSTTVTARKEAEEKKKEDDDAESRSKRQHHQ